MSESAVVDEQATEEEFRGPASAAEPKSAGLPPRAAIEIEESEAQAVYANFCRVTGTPEELVIDFALNSQPFGVPTHPLKITQRLVVNYYTAKRLLGALHMSIQRHEAAFGVLETDVQKRVTPAARRAAK